ncbi:MAG: DUF2268 domain-containing putative Zn-dependent protease [Cellulosilyticaceae bacterium]
MRIVNMIGDFRVLIEECKTTGKWEAFRNYYNKYPELWEKILGYLYMINLEGLEPMVETVDFDSLLEKVEENVHKIDEIERITQEVVEKLQFAEEFDLYIGVGLGHVSGMASLGNKPILYLGLECIGDSELAYLIPHEVNHMVRGWSVQEIHPNDFKERMIAEGLGTLYPILFNKEAINEETLAKALLIPSERMAVLLNNEVELTRNVFEKMEFTLTPELMKEFFTYKADEEQSQLAGYFVGMRMIQRLIEKGESIQRLTVMPADEMIVKYQAIL